FQAKLILRDMLGAPSLVQSVSVFSGTQTVSVQVPTLLPGVYTLSLEIPGESAMLLKKLVKGN
ncbi:MAG: hypothetical protein ACKOZV_15105, partial [Bacteroidota bacterium]